MLRDIALMAHSVLHSNLLRRGSRHYWDHTQREELDHVVGLLSDTEDPERRVIRRVLAELGAASVLDAGCGPATELVGYKKHGLKLDYLGMDGSERMLRVAQERHPEASFVRGALEAMPFGGNSFDVVLLKHVLEHQANYGPVVREATRLARNAVVVNFFHRLLPGGRDVRLRDRRGFWNNWYSRKVFERFVGILGLTIVDHTFTRGTAGQTAEVYVLETS